jgi:hypothetical protein
MVTQRKQRTPRRIISPNTVSLVLKNRARSSNKHRSTEIHPQRDSIHYQNVAPHVLHHLKIFRLALKCQKVTSQATRPSEIATLSNNIILQRYPNIDGFDNYALRGLRESAVEFINSIFAEAIDVATRDFEKYHILPNQIRATSIMQLRSSSRK